MKPNFKQNSGNVFFDYFWPSGGLRGRFWLDFGAIFESIRSFGATMGGNFGKRGLRSQKSQKIMNKTAWISQVFLTPVRLFFYSFWRRRRKHAPWKNTFSHGGYCIFRLCAFLRAAKKKRVAGQTSNENATRRRSEKQAPEHHRKAHNLIQQLSIFG